MSRLGFSVLDARAEPYGAAPTVLFRLRIEESSGEEVHAIALRCQIQIEPRRRRYAPEEEDRLFELFGEPHRWGQTLKSLLWAQVPLMVPGFTASVELDLPMPCTYDFEVVSAKYFHALDEGEVSLLFLFSGTVFIRGETGFAVEQVPWNQEASYRLPVRVWRELMDRYFPGAGWIRLGRESFDALHRYKGRRAFPTWDDAVNALVKDAEEQERV